MAATKNFKYCGHDTPAGMVLVSFLLLIYQFMGQLLYLSTLESTICNIVYSILQYTSHASV